MRRFISIVSFVILTAALFLTGPSSILDHLRAFAQDYYDRVELITYYPSPWGEYKTLRIGNPTTDGTLTIDGTTELVWYDDDSDGIDDRRAAGGTALLNIGRVTQDAGSFSGYNGQVNLLGDLTLGESGHNELVDTADLIVHGKVGIGTAEPQSRLHVDVPDYYGSLSPSDVLTANNALFQAGVRFEASRDPNFPGQFLYGDHGPDNYFWMQIGKQDKGKIKGYGADYLITEGYSLAINPLGGNVGIGTTDPQETLDVRGRIFSRQDNDTASEIYALKHITQKDTYINYTNPLDASTQSPISFYTGIIADGTETAYLYNNTWTGIDFDGAISNTGFVGARIAAQFPNLEANGIATNLLFITRNKVTNVLEERMRIDTDGSVGIGTTAPDRILHIAENSNNTGIRQENTAPPNISNKVHFVQSLQTTGIGGGRNDAFIITTRFVDINYSTRTSLTEFKTIDNGTVIDGAIPTVMALRGNKVGIGTTDPKGTLDVNGTIYQRGAQIHADYVFEPNYNLESIEEHADYMWKNKHLKAIPSPKKDRDGNEVIEIGRDRRAILEELEKAHIYIAQLNERIAALEEKLTGK